MTAELPFEIAGPFLPPALVPQELVVREVVNAPFLLRTRFACAAGEEIAMDAILGSRVTCRFYGRVVHAVVTSVEQLSDAVDGRAMFELCGGPPFATLAYRSRARIFQRRTTSAVLAQILAEGRQPHESRVVEELGERTYVCQYHQPDAAFVERILAEDGILYWFEHPASGDTATMVTADTADAYGPIEGDPRLVLRTSDAGTGLELDDRSVTSIRRGKRIGTNGVVRRDFDMERPLLRLEDRSRAMSLPPGELVEEFHPGSDEQARVQGVPPTRRAEALARGSVRTLGESLCPQLAPGRWFQLDGGDSAPRLVVESVEHFVFHPSIATQGRTYFNQFAAVPATVALRPDPPSRKPTATSETALVVGPAGEEIHTDALGRVKVRFHWDREAPEDDSASCWLRAQQAWTGAGFGAQFVPRVGTEVLVAFIAGDPDRPIVTGCLYDGVLPPPFNLPGEKRKSGFRTRSTGMSGGASHGGCHELAFDDTAGAELLTLRSQRDLKVSAPGKSVVEIDGDARTSVGGHATHSTGGDVVTQIAGKANVRVDGVALGDFAKDVAFTAREAAALAVTGPASARYGDGLSTHVEGDRRTFVSGKNGNRTYDTLSVDGDHRLGATANVAISAGESIVLRCGESCIRLLPDRILIDSPTIQIAGKREVTALQGPDRATGWKLDGSFGIVAKKVQLASAGASLVLDANASLDGALVLLNCGGSAAAVAAKNAPSEKQGDALVKLLPRNLPAGTEVTLTFAAPDGSRVEKKCRAGDSLNLTGPEGGSYALVEARLGDRIIPLRTIGKKEKSNV